jgi:hypothetical protein
MGIDSIDAAAASRIVGALQTGDPPPEHLEQLTVGREREIAYFKQKLAEVGSVGLSEVKFISAGYGAGKTHFLDVLMHIGTEGGFAVSKVDLDSRGTRFDHFEEVYAKLVQSISTRKYPENGLDRMLEEWGRGLNGMPEATIYEDLRGIPGLPVTLRTVLFEYGRAVARQDPDLYGLHADLMAWIAGNKLSVKQRNRLRNPPNIAASNATEILQGILRFIRARGHAGFLVLLDEAEAITSLTRMTSRDAANENIRSIIDGASQTPGFYFVFATTPTFLDPSQPKSAATYPALWRRISDPLGGAGSSLDKTIIELPDLTVDQYADLAIRIKSLVETARGDVGAVSEQDLRDLAGYVHQRSPDQVSTLVRSTVTILNQAASQDDFDFSSTYPFIVQEQIEQYRQEMSAE